MARTEHASRLEGVGAALAELDGMDVPEQLYEAGARLVVEHCGFGRSIFFAVAGDELVAEAVWFGPGHEAWAARVLALGREPAGRPRLADLIRETEMLRRRTAMVVPDAQDDPSTPRALVEETRTRSYVAAPIVAQRRVLGFVHADHHFAGRDVGEEDRVALSAFAAGLAYAIECALLRAHLLHRGRELDDVLRRTEALRATMTRVELDLDRRATDEAPEPRMPVLDVRPMPSGAVALLSPREREVLELLVEGATNATIARRLYVTESTAKAHVRHIFKKLQVANRAEAVATYLRQR